MGLGKRKNQKQGNMNNGASVCFVIRAGLLALVFLFSSRVQADTDARAEAAPSTALKPLVAVDSPEVVFPVQRAHPTRPPAKVEVIGVASWYGRREQGRTMANGRPYDRHAMTAAHRTLPLGTKLIVRNGDASIAVIITDRPSLRYAHRLDLSEAAFSRLAPKSRGLIPVNIVHVVKPPPL